MHAANRVPLAERQREWESGLEEGVGYRKRAERWAGIGNTLVPERLDYRDADGNRTRDTEAVELYGARATPWVLNSLAVVAWAHLRKTCVALKRGRVRAGLQGRRAQSRCGTPVSLTPRRQTSCRT